MNKKILLFMFILLIPSIVKAEEVKEVTLSNCVDMSSARFIYNKEEIKIKFIGIEKNDEYIIDNKDDELNGKTVDEYVCNLLTNADKITIEYEPNISRTDKFGRENAWIFLDGELLESHLVRAGYVKVAFLYDDYKYNDELLENEKYAKDNNLGIWSKKEEEPLVEETKLEEKKKDIFSMIGDFFAGFFKSIGDFFNDIIEGITNEQES